MRTLYIFLFIILISPLNKSFGQDTLSGKSIQLIAVGDIMMGSDYPKNYLPVNDGAEILNNVYNILKDADITFGNLEGVLMDGGKPYKTCNNPSLCYLFRTPARYIKYLKEAGFDVLSLANNHALDFGEIGRTKTMETLDEAAILYSGRIGSVAIWDVNGIKCGMIAFTANRGSYYLLDIDKAKIEVSKLAEKCDVVIVSFHGGAEGNKALHVKNQMETAYGEKRGNVYKFSHSVIDAGADLVIGHGPHVPRGMELYNDRLIAYSLGNFCTYGRFNLDGPKGIAPILKVEIDQEGKFIGGQIFSTYQEKTSGPRIDPDNRAVELVKDLTESDFPNTGVKISDNGNLLSR